MFTANLKRPMKVELLYSEQLSEPRFVTAKALRCASDADFNDEHGNAMTQGGREFVRLFVFDAIDTEGRTFLVGRYPEGHDPWHRPEGVDYDSHVKNGLAHRRPAILKVALDNIDSIEERD